MSAHATAFSQDLGKLSGLHIRGCFFIQEWLQKHLTSALCDSVSAWWITLLNLWINVGRVAISSFRLNNVAMSVRLLLSSILCCLVPTANNPLCIINCFTLIFIDLWLTSHSVAESQDEHGGQTITYINRSRPLTFVIYIFKRAWFRHVDYSTEGWEMAPARI